MKKLLIVFLLLLSLSLYSEIRVGFSIFGAMSCPYAWPHISCITKGTNLLNEDRFKRFRIIGENDGATFTRETCFWLPPKDIEFDRGYLPFKFYDDKYDLTQLNPIYFDNIRKMVLITNKHGQTLCQTIFDRCHSNKKFPHSPYRRNHQGIKSFYDLPDSILIPYLKMLVDRTKYKYKKAFSTKRNKVMYEVVNEPFDVQRYPKFFIRVRNYLVKRGVKTMDIIPGHFHWPDNPVAWAYKKAMREAGIYKKYDYYSVAHGWGSDEFNPKDWYNLQRHLRPGAFFDDGRHPKNSEEYWLVSLKDYFSHGPNRWRRNKAFKKCWIIDHMWKEPGDDIHGSRGISEAIKWYTGKYPGKFKKYSK